MIINRKVSVNPEVARAASGFTLLELLLAVGIIGFLATIFWPTLESMRTRAEKVVCVGNVRSLHVAMGAYLGDNKHWPQPSEELTEEQFDEFWLEVLGPYGTSENNWRCPSVARMARFQAASEEDRKKAAKQIHYLPTTFDDNPMRPHKYPTHPWFMEIGGPHGNGNILIYANGQVKELNDLLREAGHTPPDSGL